MMRETECRKIFDVDYDNYDADNRVYSADGIAPTLITRLDQRGFWVFAVDTYNKAIHEDCMQTITTGVSFRNHDYIGEMEMKEREEDKPEVLAGIGEKKSNNGTQWYEQSRIYDSGKVATAIPAEQSFHPFYGGNLRVRKLTPCECMRLMAFTKEDYLSLVGEGGQSASQIYHEAGDSIVVNCLIGLFCGLVGADAEPIQKRWAERCSKGME